MTVLTKAFAAQAANMREFGYEDTTAWDVLADWRAWVKDEAVDHPRFYFSARTFAGAIHIYGGPESVDPYADSQADDQPAV